MSSHLPVTSAPELCWILEAMCITALRVCELTWNEQKNLKGKKNLTRSDAGRWYVNYTYHIYNVKTLAKKVSRNSSLITTEVVACMCIGKMYVYP
jgi:hypothetical protein